MANPLLIIAHTPSTNTRMMVDAMADACRNTTELNCQVLSPLSIGAEEVLSAQGILLFTPENFGYMCGALKDFFERIYYPCLERTHGLPYCVCARAGQDNGSGAATSIKRITTGLRWREAQPALLCAGTYQESFCHAAAEFAATFAAGLEVGLY